MADKNSMSEADAKLKMKVQRSPARSGRTISKDLNSSKKRERPIKTKNIRLQLKTIDPTFNV